MASFYAEMVELYKEAIRALVLGGASSYSIGARTVTKLDLNELNEQLLKYQQLAERESGGGIFRKAAIRRPSP
jgi:hypothetical protein